MGAEAAEEFDEPFAPSKEYGELLGHSIYFMSKDVGKPIHYTAPTYALRDISKIPHYKKFNVKDHGCWLWWIEYGGRLDTVHQTEEIKWELWKVVYGVWDHIKNSGLFPEAENLTLEWVGQIPGKRESRRFEGHYILKQSDIVQQTRFTDAVAHGGWAIDLHPADGVFSEKPSCNQWHSKGVYEIPMRCMISKNIENLFLAGRIISCSHVAMGSTRVMATCAHAAQAVGVAAAVAIEEAVVPQALLQPYLLEEVQQRLLSAGQHIPHVVFQDRRNFLSQQTAAAESTLISTSSRSSSVSSTLATGPHSKEEHPSCQIEASSYLQLSEIPFDHDWMKLEFSAAQLLPLDKGAVPVFEISAKASAPSTLTVSLRKSSKVYNYTPDVTIATKTLRLGVGEQMLTLDFEAMLEEGSYVFLCFHQNEEIFLRTSTVRITGLVSVFNKQSPAVSNYGRQEPDTNLGFESFEFWVPIRRPKGHNFAMKINPGLSCFGVENLINGFHRPYLHPNAWVADLADPDPTLSFCWSAPQGIGRIVLRFDTDWDHAMESSLLGHSERVMPFVVRNYQILNQEGEVIEEIRGNYQSRNVIHFKAPLFTDTLTIRFEHPSQHVPVSLFGISIYASESL
ncbi:MAG: FAD-dependent oxidoreductase, partial [Saprospiraceae bacterium]|nr:FAD-dependent oxidoreductase [Saprospiraceae bacterium]